MWQQGKIYSSPSQGTSWKVLGVRLYRLFPVCMQDILWKKDQTGDDIATDSDIHHHRSRENSWNIEFLPFPWSSSSWRQMFGAESVMHPPLFFHTWKAGREEMKTKSYVQHSWKLWCRISTKYVGHSIFPEKPAGQGIKNRGLANSGSDGTRNLSSVSLMMWNIVPNPIPPDLQAQNS